MANMPTSDEFIIDSKNLPLVHEFQKKIERMFSIKLVVENFEGDDNGKTWLKIDGERRDRKNAQEYIIATCEPQSTQKLNIDGCDLDIFNDDTLEQIEKQSNAALMFVDDTTIEIKGTEIAVILAMSSLESLGPCSLQDTETDGETKLEKERSSNDKWSKQMDTKLERLLSTTGDGNESISISDFNKTTSSVKMTILKCMNDFDEISDSDLFPTSGDEGNQTYRVPIYIDDDEDVIELDRSDSSDGHCVGNLTERMTSTQISPSSTPKPVKLPAADTQYLRQFGKSVGYTDSEIEEGLSYCDEKTKPADFLEILSKVQQNKERLNDTSKDQPMDVTDGENTPKKIFPPPPDVPSPSGSGSFGRRSLPHEYKKKLIQDFSEETSELTVDELKRRNEERQKVLKSAFDREESAKNQDDTSDQVRSPVKKKRRKKKKKKKKTGDNQTKSNTEKPETVSISSSDGEEETQVMKVWTGNKQQDSKTNSDSDECQITEESFPQPVVRVPMNNIKHKGQVPHNLGQDRGQAPYSVGQDRLQAPQNLGQGPYNIHTGRGLYNNQNRCYRPSSNIPPQRQPFPPMTFNQPPPLLPLPNSGAINPGIVRYPNQRPSVPRNIPPQTQQAGGRQDRHLRYVVIDGSNVAMCHGNGKIFSCRGIEIVIDYFIKRGHKQITAFVPEWRKYNPRPENPISNQNVLMKLKEDGYLVFTPSRRINNRLISSYDDRFVLELAEREDGVIVSNDQYRDLMREKYSWKKIIEERLLLFSFAGDNFMPPFDPLGRDGPTLDDFLCKSQPPARKRQISPPYQEANPQINAWFNQNAGKKQKSVAKVPPNQCPPFQGNQPYNKRDDTQTQGRGGQQTKTIRPERDKDKTKEFEDHLKTIFPDNVDKIKEILQNHPCEMNLERLSNYLMNAIFKS